jgi:pilus assembly protein CpaE
VGELSFFVCSPLEEAARALTERLEATGHASVLGTCTDADMLADEVRARKLDALFVDLMPNPEAMLTALERLPQPLPLLLVSGPQEDSQLLLRAMRLGVKEFFGPGPSEYDVRASVERLLLRGEREIERPKQPAPLLAVLGAKGGVGATTVACQLAFALQRRAPAVVVDLDVPSGDVALYLDVTPSYHLGDLRVDAESVDATFLRSLLATHPSGIRVLAAPKRIEDLDQMSVRNLERTLELLQKDFAWVVVDASRLWNDWSLRALDLVDQILLVTSFDLPTLNHTRTQLELFRRLGHLSKVRLIANRKGSVDTVGARDFTDFLEREPDAYLPSDFQRASSCIAEGKSLDELAPSSALNCGYEELAGHVHRWCGVPLPKRERPRGLARFLQRLRGRRHVPA